MAIASAPQRDAPLLNRADGRKLLSRHAAELLATAPDGRNTAAFCKLEYGTDSPWHPVEDFNWLLVPFGHEFVGQWR